MRRVAAFAHDDAAYQAFRHAMRVCETLDGRREALGARRFAASSRSRGNRKRGGERGDAGKSEVHQFQHAVMKPATLRLNLVARMGQGVSLAAFYRLTSYLRNSASTAASSGVKSHS